MFVVRNTFTAKPGMASKLAKQLKEAMTALPGTRARVLTDHVGAMNTVVLEMEFPDIASWERSFAEYASGAEVQQKMAGYTDLYVTGRREILRVV